MKINHMNCVIELTKTEMKAAETFGSEMYKALREARQDNPNYRVKVATASKKVDRYKGLTVAVMEKFIQKDDKKGELLKEFYMMRGLTPEGEPDEFACAVSYGELKQWFLVKCPKYKDMRDSVDQIMEDVRKKTGAKKAD